MTKAQLIETIKNNRVLYKVYYSVMSVLLRVIKVFVRTDEKLVLFVSYGGRYFNDSPKCIFDAMKKDSRFSEYKLIWAFRNMSDFHVEHAIKIDTLKYFITALKARCWVTNVNIERGVVFRGKHTYYFHTTHGTLPKLTGNDVKNGAFFGGDFKYQYDCSCAQSEEEKRYQLSMFNLRPEQVLVCGYPKNDLLAKSTDKDKREIIEELGIEPGKKIILYAPTFRENEKDNKIKIDIEKWEKVFGEEYVMLFRAHPVLVSKMDKSFSSKFVLDVSTYPDNSKLMIAADMLISDYSGIFFEFAVLHRPMFYYAYDYDSYQKNRGLYFDIRKELPGSEDEDTLISTIKNFNNSNDFDKVEHFISKYVTEYGNATQKSVDNIFYNITAKNGREL